ncbi:hypothetical protein JCM30237_05820 [Halolamina litorea]|uniref:Transmembrane protein n=1 Tax=Halolamina litorea TaxID=1515593 RepID=A0ABD6BPF4_9EURY|nr:hypothetical protein [Halolamina litorea]
MDYLAKALHRATYDRVAYEPIREDFISWYVSAYRDLGIEEQIDWDNGRIVEKAIEARTEAQSYEPDTTLNTAIKVTSEVDAFIKSVSALLTLVGFLLGGVLAMFGLYNPYSTSISVLSWAFSSGALIFPGGALPFYALLKYTVQTNSELIRQYNADLVVSIGRITRAERRRELTTAFYIHHSSLCSTKQVPVIVFLGLLRAISPGMYGLVSYRLKQDISEYEGSNFWKIAGKEYSRLKRGRYPRISE